MSKKKLYTVSTEIYHNNYIEANSALQAEEQTKNMLNDILDDSFNVEVSKSKWLKDENQFIVTTIIHHLNYIEATSELKAEQQTNKELLDRLDDSYSVEASKVVASESIKNEKDNAR